jgi:hypothetical protein
MNVEPIPETLVPDLTHRDPIHEGDPATWEARKQITVKIAEYGSIDRWPTLGLLPSQFSICKCGCPRSAHRMLGTQRMGCRKKDCNCEAFKAPIFDNRRRH